MGDARLALPLLLNLVPNVRVNDGRVLPVKDLSFVPDHACIDRVAGDVQQMPAVKSRPAADLAG